MRFLIAGVKAGKSCIVDTVDCTMQGSDSAMKRLLELSVAELPPRPHSDAQLYDMALPPGSLRWLRTYFPPHRDHFVHHTDTVDFLNVMAGRVALVLDDGPHMLEAGDSAVVKGVDHGWRTGAESCIISGILIGTPAP
jgi:quercetin dioxygenase-like cupin family protein